MNISICYIHLNRYRWRKNYELARKRFISKTFHKDNKIIYEESGYVPYILGISEPAYGECINFYTDIHAYILGWKEKNMKQKIIDYLEEEKDDN